MRTTIIIPAHNEGEALAKTVASVRETMDIDGQTAEIVISDDATSDGSVDAVRDEPGVRIERFAERAGVSRTKHQGARMAAGDVLIFLDGHCKPEPGALLRMVEDVEATGGDALVTPRICSLDEAKWLTELDQPGHGYVARLERMINEWVELEDMQTRTIAGDRVVYESPNLQGCVFAVSRRVYQRLRGFDLGMQCWGSEDVDFGIKAWLMGHPILHDPEAIVGHRYQVRFDRYEVPMPHVIANQMRMARKCLSEAVWEDWLVEYGSRMHRKTWRSAWRIFKQYRESVEQERAYLFANRLHDEFWYREQFNLAWPIAEGDDDDEEDEEDDDEEAFPFPGVSPSNARKGHVTVIAEASDDDEGDEDDDEEALPFPGVSPSNARKGQVTAKLAPASRA